MRASAALTGVNLRPISVYAYGVARNRLEQAARRLSAPLLLTDDFGEAEAIVTLKTHYRRRPRLISDGEKRGLSIYVLRANTVTQMENFLVDLFRLNGRRDADVFGDALLEAERAISRIRAGEKTTSTYGRKPRKCANANINWRGKRGCSRPASAMNRGAT